ncbi:MAG: PadR family transcriptional regulator [bacterium]|nr:PadR family transcriptional regulator [bacterium]
MKPKVELVKGTLDIMILKSLSWGPMHGYSVSRWIRQTTNEALQIEEGALYPALHRMEERGWLKAEWGLSENNRRAKFYHLTDLGRKQLKAGESSWTSFAEALAKILGATERPAWAQS